MFLNACGICLSKVLINLFYFMSADGLTYFEDLLEGESLLSSLRALEKDYDNAIKDYIDERVFVDEEDNLLGTGSLS